MYIEGSVFSYSIVSELSDTSSTPLK